MMDDLTTEQIMRYRRTAQSMGEAALDALKRGDIGQARTAARQAAQNARIAVQLESGESQSGPSERSRDYGSESSEENLPV